MSREYPCIYFERGGMCRKFSDDHVTSYCVMGPCPEQKLSNADRIRAMSDEELASALVQYKGTEKRIIPYGLYEYIFRGPNGKRCGTRDYAVQLWLDWLQSPEEET